MTPDFEPHRRELLAHCYRMLGSIHDAEDVVQDTLLRAWRAYDRYDENLASVRTWLYRIATNRCLTALGNRDRRPIPSDLTSPSAPGTWPPEPGGEVSWLQPIPDAMLDPAMIAENRGSVRLALVAAVQHLPARQRAVLLLRDVLAWSAAEVADLLGTSTASVNSALQRARAQLDRIGLTEDDVRDTDHALLDRYLAAFTEADINALTTLLREDVVMEMPPHLTWFDGRDAVSAFYRTVFSRRAPGGWRAVPTAANGQLAAGSYLLGDPHAIHVITVRDNMITRIMAFQDKTLFPTFGLPLTLPQAPR